MINIPVIEDKLAIRAVTYRHDTSGFINNTAGTVLATNGFVRQGIRAADIVAAVGGADLYQNEDDVGNTTHNGGRVAALWKPVDALSVTLQHVYQDVDQEGQPYVELGVGGGYEQITVQFGDVEGLSGKQPGHSDEINITNLVLEYDLDWANLLSSSAWMEEDSAFNRDESAFGGRPVPFLTEASTETFSQELRLASQLEGPLQFVAGVYYEETDLNGSTERWGSTDAQVAFLLSVFGLPGNPFGSTSHQVTQDDFDRSIDQLAYYAELSYEFNEQLELTLGARRFDYERSFRNIQEGLFGSGEQSSQFDESGTNVKVNLSYTPNDDTLVYAQWAEGFRLGNAVVPPPSSICDVNNDGVLDGTGVSLKNGFDSDTTENIELGAKLTLLNDRLQVNAAAYRIDWQDIPLFVFGGALPGQAQTCFLGAITNAGEARSQGFEIETTYQITQNLRGSLGGAYTDAELTEDSPSIGGVSGDRLPSSPDYNINVGLQYEFELAGHASYVSGDYAYVSQFYNRLGETGVALGDYGQLNVSAGTALNNFNIELFAHNLTNEDALTHADTLVPDNRAYQLRPRTIGLNIGYQF